MRTQTPHPPYRERGTPASPFPERPFLISAVDLVADREEVVGLWNASQTQYVPLSLAAAFIFHHTRRGDETALTGNEYAAALDIAATVLSCLVPVYALNEQGERIAVPVNLSRQRFRNGATQLLRADGTIVASMSIVRSDVLHAILTIERDEVDISYQAPRRLQI